MSDDQLAEARARMERAGFPVGGATNDQIRQALNDGRRELRDSAPMTAARPQK